jgi:6-phosphofructokinase 1
MRKIGILTGGGDCPGLNAVIRGVVEECAANGIEVYGFSAGWRGALTGEGRWLSLADVSGLQTKGGTILESSRTNVMKEENGPERVRKTLESLGLEGLVAIGGDDTLGVANKLRKMGMKMIGVPKTIDNDLSCTDYTFGFDTASNIAMECIDRLHTTAASHARCIVVECMGRHTGWIAVQAGLAADANLILIPEFPKTFDEIMQVFRARYIKGERHTIIAVAEGFELKGETDEDVGLDAFGNKLLLEKEIAKTLATRIEKAYARGRFAGRKAQVLRVPFGRSGAYPARRLPLLLRPACLAPDWASRRANWSFPSSTEHGRASGHEHCNRRPRQGRHRAQGSRLGLL